MHTKSYNGLLLDIDKLNELIYAYEIKQINISDIDWSTVGITKDSGYSYKRLKNADYSIPIILDKKYGVLDGRHRLLKALINNKRKISFRFANKKDIEKCIIKK